MATRVRLANVGDIHQLCTLMDMLRTASVWGTVPFKSDYQYASDVFKYRLTDPNNRILVIDNAGELFGMCGGNIQTHDFIPSIKYMLEWAFWIDPALRGRGWARKLWEPMCAWAKHLGAVGAIYGKPRLRGTHKCVEEMIWTYWGS